MAYTPTNWSDGDIVNATKLNKIEQGIASIVLVVNETVTDSNGDTIHTLDKTWKQIHDQIASGYLGSLVGESDGYTYIESIYSVYQEEWYYSLNIAGNDYSTDNENGYPTYTEAGEM